jgi:transcriptional regulator
MRLILAITRLEGKWKMSQNREMRDQVGVVEGLSRRDNGDDLEIVKIISRQIKPAGSSDQG